MELRGQKNYASRLDTCRRASIFFYNRGTTTLSVRVNRGEATTETFEPVGDLQEMTVEEISVPSVDGGECRFHLVLWSCHGRHFGHRARQLLIAWQLRPLLRSVPVWMMREFNEQRPYDLIILQYGLNVATERGRNYDKYIAGMQTTVRHLRKPFRKLPSS